MLLSSLIPWMFIEINACREMLITFHFTCVWCFANSATAFDPSKSWFFSWYVEKYCWDIHLCLWLTIVIATISASVSLHLIFCCKTLLQYLFALKSGFHYVVIVVMGSSPDSSLSLFSVFKSVIFDWIELFVELFDNIIHLDVFTTITTKWKTGLSSSMCCECLLIKPH